MVHAASDFEVLMVVPWILKVAPWIPSRKMKFDVGICVLKLGHGF